MYEKHYKYLFIAFAKDFSMKIEGLIRNTFRVSLRLQIQKIMQGLSHVPSLHLLTSKSWLHAKYGIEYHSIVSRFIEAKSREPGMTVMDSEHAAHCWYTDDSVLYLSQAGYESLKTERPLENWLEPSQSKTWKLFHAFQGRVGY